MLGEILDIMISNPIPLILIIVIIVFTVWRGAR